MHLNLSSSCNGLPVGQEIVWEFRVYYTSCSSKAKPRNESDKSLHLWEWNPSHSIHHSCSEYSNTSMLQQQYELINRKLALGFGKFASLCRKSLRGWTALFLYSVVNRRSTDNTQKAYFLPTFSEMWKCKELWLNFNLKDLRYQFLPPLHQ